MTELAVLVIGLLAYAGWKEYRYYRRQRSFRRGLGL